MLHLMDIKFVAEYNSAVHKICSKLQFCNQHIDNAEKIEKILSTFLLANRLLQQQYRRHKYIKYSNLTYDLLQAEKYDELLTKNHLISPRDASPMPEVHFNIQNNNKKFGGKKLKKNFKGKWNKNRQNYMASKGHNKGKGTEKDTLKFVKGVVVTTTTPGSATFPYT
jgi:hypothetical protein